MKAMFGNDSAVLMNEVTKAMMSGDLGFEMGADGNIFIKAIKDMAGGCAGFFSKSLKIKSA